MPPRYPRCFALAHEDAGQRQPQRRLHDLDRQRLQLQRQVGLGGRGAGEALQVDVGRCQNLAVALVLLKGGWTGVKAEALFGRLTFVIPLCGLR